MFPSLLFKIGDRGRKSLVVVTVCVEKVRWGGQGLNLVANMAKQGTVHVSYFAGLKLLLQLDGDKNMLIFTNCFQQKVSF